MTSASLSDSIVVHAPSVVGSAAPCDTDALGETIAALAARLHAATYELLVLLAEFDARTGWNNGFLSCAHWLHWRTGIDLGAAREKVRVARALPALPLVSARMQRGQLSYAKVRALTRVATPENEQALVDFALAGTAAHVERFVRAWRRVDRVRGGAAGRIAASQSSALDVGRRRRHGGHPRPAHAGGGRRRAARPRGRRRSAVPRRRVRRDAATRCPKRSRPRSGGPMRWACSPKPPCRRISMRARRVTAIRSWCTSTPRPRRGTVRSRGTPTRSRTPSTVRSKWTMARSTFPRKRRAAWRAMRRSCTCRARRAAPCSAWAARPAPFRRRSAARWPRATPPAASPAARRAAATRIMSSTGPMAARRASTICCCCAAVIIAPCTKAGFQAVRGVDGGIEFHRPDGALIPKAPDMPPLRDVRTEHAPVAVASIPVWDGTPFDVAWAIDVLYQRPCGVERSRMNKMRKAVGAVETVLWFPRSLWARCPPEGRRGQGVHSSGSFHGPVNTRH